MTFDIGTLNEGPLHAALKARYVREGDATEQEIDGFVVDVKRADEIIEIQTGGFARIKRKLLRLTEHSRVRLVHPIPMRSWIVYEPPERGRAGGRRSSPKRLSPKRQGLDQIFLELVSIPELIAHPNFSLDVVMTHEEQVRRRDRRRRSGYRILERRLVDVARVHHFGGPEDLAALLPEDLPSPFDTAELGFALGTDRWVAQKAAYCLRAAGVIEETGKRGNARLFARIAPPGPTPMLAASLDS